MLYAFRMQDDATPAPSISLIDALDWIEDEYSRRAEEDQRRAELFAFGLQGVMSDLAMELHAECAARGIDWRDLLATAAERCLQPKFPN